MLQINVLGRKPPRRFCGFRKNQILCLTRVLVVVGLGTALAALAREPNPLSRVARTTTNDSPQVAALNERPASLPYAVTLRRVYRHSVVPGGVEDAEELREAMARDTVVARHYERVRLANIEETVVKQPKFAYVSYRMREQLYWTRRPVLLHIGEKLLTDGRTVIRARCGNQVAFVPRLPVAQADPTDMEIVGDLIPPPKRKIPAVLVIPPPDRKRFVPIPPIFPPPGKRRPPRVGAGDSGFGVPWPAIAAGIAGIFFLRSRLGRGPARRLPRPA